VLARGYAILQNKQGIIMQANLRSKGEKITAITKDAELHLITEEVKKKPLKINSEALVNFFEYYFTINFSTNSLCGVATFTK
jgi:hypothetical protein